MTHKSLQAEAAALTQDAAPILQATNVHKTYKLGRVRVPVLRGVDIEIKQGETVAVLGASGSGKSTLLHILGGLDKPDRGKANALPEGNAGEVRYQGESLSTLSQGAVDTYRNRAVGFVFQFYHLLPELTVLQNTMIPAMMGVGRVQYMAQKSTIEARAKELLERFGLGHRLKHRSVELSGGERQRVAIARALINNPPVLLADEPTGNLDQATGAGILDALMEYRASEEEPTQTHTVGPHFSSASGPRTMVIVTHDAQTAQRADRVVHLKDGLVVEG